MQRTIRIALLELVTGQMPEHGNRPQIEYKGDALEKLLTAANALQPDILIGPEYLFYSGTKAFT